jgi:hypothetical protein
VRRFSKKIRVLKPAFLFGEFSSSAVGVDVSCNDSEMKCLVFHIVFGDGGISEQPGSFFSSSSDVVFVAGGLVLAEAGGCVVYSEGIFCGGFDIDDVFSSQVIFCVDVLAFYVPSCAFDAHVVHGDVDIATNDMAIAYQRWLGNHTGDNAMLYGISFYQLVRSGWFSVPTSGGLLSLPGVSSSGVKGLLVVEAPDPSFSGDAMATGHLPRPGRSAITKHVGISDVLLLVPLKTFDVPSSARWSASRRLFRPSAARTTGRVL